MKPLRYLFYRIHQSEPKTIGALAWIAPLFLTAMACGSNVLCLAALMLWATGNLPEGRIEVQDVRDWLVLVVAIILAVLYYRWIVSGRYARFAEEFGAESSAQRKMRTVLMDLYGLVTVVAPIAIGYFAGKHR